MNEYLGEFPTFKRGDWTPKDWALCYIQAYGGIDGDHPKPATEKPATEKAAAKDEVKP